MSIKINQLDFSGQKIYVGIDAHRKHFTVSIQGEELFYKTFSQPAKVGILVDHLKRKYPGATYLAAYEAGFSGFWLREELEKQGIKCMVVNACDIPTTDREKKQKRDPLDSRKISRSLKNGELRALHVPEKWTQHDRGLLRVRQKMIGDQTRCRNRIKAHFEHSGTHWSKRFVNWLSELDFGHASGKATLGLLLKEAIGLRELLLESNKLILKLSQRDEYRDNVKLLLSVPGIGRLTAMTLLTELGDVTRFRGTDDLCAYLGLMPNVYASGDKEKVGDITKRGNKHLRTCIIESSWVAVRNDPALGLKYHQLCSRMVGNKAIIRIARKLMNRIRHVLISKEEYKFSLAA
jgi:transposase